MKKIIAFIGILVSIFIFGNVALAADPAPFTVSYVFFDIDDIEIADAPGEGDIKTFEIEIAITATEDVYFLDEACEEDGTDEAGQGMEFKLAHGGKNTLIECWVANGPIFPGDTDDMYLVAAGTTRHTTVGARVQATDDHTSAMTLKSLNWTTDPTDLTPNNFYKSGFGSGSLFKTDFAVFNYFE